MSVGYPSLTCPLPSPRRHLMRQVHDELREPDGGPGRGAPLRPEPRHWGLVQQLLQHQGHAVPAGEWGREEAWLAGGRLWDLRIPRLIRCSTREFPFLPYTPAIFLSSDTVSVEKRARLVHRG